jgi:uncharacterized protein YcbK (DUF882 family)
MKENDWNNNWFFRISEFDSPDAPGSGINMDYEFMAALNTLRLLIGQPLHVTSGYRTEKYNESLINQGYPAVNDSAHTKGLACDIACNESSIRYKILENASLCGFKRIGISESFIHLDMDTSRAQEVLWVYK